jgi:hypothetical protein
MWEVKGGNVDPTRFATFEPIRILNYYDGPRLFTFEDEDRALCLACWSDEDESRSRFLVVPTSQRIIADMEGGVLSVSEALAQPRLWVVDLAHDGTLKDAWLTSLEEVPSDCQPQPRAMLDRLLEPILSLRATGDAIRPGEIPGSVIKFTVEGAQRAIKCLAEFEIDQPISKGRPSRALQKMYDLPVLRTLEASFEVQFRSPLREPNLFDGLEEGQIREEHAVLERVAGHLRTGLAWLTTASSSALPVPDNPDLSRAIISALKSLAPPSRGPIKELEIRGELATQDLQPVVLSRRARSILAGALSRVPGPKERRVEVNGRIRELNEKLMRFELHSPAIRVCEFEPFLWDDVHELLGADEVVFVVGVETGPSSNIRVINLVRSANSEEA